MSTVTRTINASTNPTYGGHITYDGVITYTREVLSARNPEVHFNGVLETQRIFAFFDLSTDPTSGGAITKVELLATMSSVGGTHAVRVVGGEIQPFGASVGEAVGSNDDSIYLEAGPSGSDFPTLVSSTTPTAGASVIDLGATSVTQIAIAVTNLSGFFIGIALVNEAASGSVVFDAAVGFGLRITHTSGASGPANIKTINTVVIANVAAINSVPIANVASWNNLS